MQFHPEVTHSGSAGRTLLRNFVVNICGASATWNMSNIADKFIQQVNVTLASSSSNCIYSLFQVRDRVGEESHVIGAVVGDIVSAFRELLKHIIYSISSLVV